MPDHDKSIVHPRVPDDDAAMSAHRLAIIAMPITKPAIEWVKTQKRREE